MFGLSRDRERVVAAVDIDSASVAAAILLLRPGAAATVLSAHRSLLPLSQRSSAATTAAVAAAIADAARDALAGAPSKRPETVYAIVRSPWTASRVLHTETQYEADARIDDDLIKRLAEEALAGASGVDRSQLLEAAVARVELNGYPTRSPAGKRARAVAVSVLASDCHAKLRAVADQALARAFSDAPRSWRSGMRAAITATGALEHVPKHRLIVDVGGEETDIIVIRRGTLAQQQRVAQGTRPILERLGGVPEETLNVIRMIAQDQCAVGACERLNTAMAQAEPDLVRRFGEAFAKLAQTRRLPNHLTLLAHPDLAPWLARIFTRIDFAQFTVTALPFSVETLRPALLGHFAVSEGASVVDPGIMIAAALVNIETR